MRNFPATTDVILSAPDIDWEYAVVERQSTDDLTTSPASLQPPKQSSTKTRPQDLELPSGTWSPSFSKADIRVPNSQQTKFVRLEGEFVASGVYSVQPGETLRQLVSRAGGLTADAYLYASEFTRESVRRIERQRIIEYADALEGEITARSANLASAALTDEMQLRRRRPALRPAPLWRVCVRRNPPGASSSNGLRQGHQPRSPIWRWRMGTAL